MQCVQCRLVHKYSHSFCIKLISWLGFQKFVQWGLLASICRKMHYFYLIKKFKINEGQSNKEQQDPKPAFFEITVLFLE